MVRAAVLALAAALLVACGASPSTPGDAAVGADLVRPGDAVGDALQVDAAQLDAASPDAIVQDAGPDALPGDIGADAALPRPSATSLLPCTRNADCDDGIACTDDLCGSRPDGSRRCTYNALPSMCGAGETCDIRYPSSHPRSGIGLTLSTANS